MPNKDWYIAMSILTQPHDSPSERAKTSAVICGAICASMIVLYLVFSFIASANKFTPLCDFASTAKRYVAALGNIFGFLGIVFFLNYRSSSHRYSSRSFAWPAIVHGRYDKKTGER